MNWQKVQQKGLVNILYYEGMTPEQKQAYGFVKLTKEEVFFMTQTISIQPMMKDKLIATRPSHLKLVINN